MTQSSNPLAQTLTVLALSLASSYLVVKGAAWAIGQLDPLKTKKSSGRAKMDKVAKRLGLQQTLKLSEYEEVIATEVVFPEDIAAGFEDIGGLDSVITSLRETVMLPLCHSALFSRSLSPPKGVLLYGPPGCGKTLLAKSMAKESGATFINLHISTLMDKWFGESQKLVNAVFSLAKKLQPSIVFIDEIDCFLRERSRGDHEAMGMMKAEFMTLWDGLETDSDTRVVVLGATNRPNDLDQAILRRMPKRFHIQAPGMEQRIRILSLILKDEELDAELTLEDIAKCTAGFSGSDLKEVCRNAAFVPVQELIRKHQGSIETLDMKSYKKRPLKFLDFFPKNATGSGTIHGTDGTLTGKLDLD